MFLPANVKLTNDLAGCSLICGERIATGQVKWLFKVTGLFDRCIYVQYSGQGGNIDLDQIDCIPGLGACISHHSEQCLAVIHHFVLSKDGIIPHHRAAVITPGNITCAQNSMNPGGRKCLVNFDAVQCTMGSIAQPQGDMNAVCRQGHIINIAGLTCDM